jgi:type IV pilus assembly protein PilB
VKVIRFATGEGNMRRIPIGQMLVEGGRIDLRQLRAGLDWQRRWGGRLGSALIHLGFLREQDLFIALGRQFQMPVVLLAAREVSPEILALVPERTIRDRQVLPIELLAETRRGPLLVAISDPLDVAAIDDVAFMTGKQIRAVLAATSDLEEAIARNLASWRFQEAVDLPPEPVGDMELVSPPRTHRYMN